MALEDRHDLDRAPADAVDKAIVFDHDLAHVRVADLGDYAPRARRARSQARTILKTCHPEPCGRGTIAGDEAPDLFEV